MSGAETNGAAPAGQPRRRRAIEALLGRTPNAVELAMFEAMWSEHCGYTHSRPLLRALPTGGGAVRSGPGGNAGVVEVAPGLGLAFKVESHNHPSAVDPFHGAATGLGGILRDVLAMGARPIAFLDALRFGPPDTPRHRFLREGVVRGIAHYGNACGVPTVGGEIGYGRSFGANPLVNVACLGIVPLDRLAQAAARGVGNTVLYAGARTGRDGLGGARFASESLASDESAHDRSAIQIGDPFAGKLLIEASLETLATGAVVAIQDLGAAGLTCAAAEMAAAGGLGIELELDRVPVRERGMGAIERLLSESQERMLLVLPPDRVPQVVAIYRRWGLVAQPVGRVLAEPVLRVRFRGEIVAELPPSCLAEPPTAPIAPAAPAERLQRRDHAIRPEARRLPAADTALLALLGDPELGSRAAVYERFDHMVQLRTVWGPGQADAAVLRLLEAPPRAIAVAIDANDRAAFLDPRTGAALSVCESALNVACTGARPLACTDGINAGDPEQPTGAWELAGVVQGLAEACSALDLPVVGGNVSLYNGAGDTAVRPTPVVCTVGVIEDVAHSRGAGFVAAGDAVLLVQTVPPTLAASLFWERFGGGLEGRPPRPRFEPLRALIDWLVDTARTGSLRSAHDVAHGGLAVALAECALLGGLGLEAALPPDGEPVEVLFGEAPGAVVVSCAAARRAEVVESARAQGLEPICLGRTIAEPVVRIGCGPLRIETQLAQLRAVWGGAP